MAEMGEGTTTRSHILKRLAGKTKASLGLKHADREGKPCMGGSACGM